MSSNCVDSLPSSLEMLRLDSLDVSGNLLGGGGPLTTPTVGCDLAVGCPSLLEISARVVELKRCVAN